ncbi:hypothetical protein RHMOL_Rhmol02G0162900 [Rhododendron molle]|uniref:Uncharacterized protein n=1 Tax=Rhododendron molle TaxID=49168 RepID=A0ACC0PQV5_RHOML|nr:hypothetical protein RHMOL_Rhmol02G0162900 [Rhododendron molle]
MEPKTELAVPRFLNWDISRLHLEDYQIGNMVDEEEEEVEEEKEKEEEEQGDATPFEQVAEEGRVDSIEKVVEEGDSAEKEDSIEKVVEEGGDDSERERESGDDSEMNDMFHTAEAIDEQFKSTNQSASTFVPETQFSK